MAIRNSALPRALQLYRRDKTAIMQLMANDDQ